MDKKLKMSKEKSFILSLVLFGEYRYFTIFDNIFRLKMYYYDYCKLKGSHIFDIPLCMSHLFLKMSNN